MILGRDGGGVPSGGGAGGSDDDSGGSSGGGSDDDDGGSSGGGRDDDDDRTRTITSPSFDSGDDDSGPSGGGSSTGPRGPGGSPSVPGGSTPGTPTDGDDEPNPTNPGPQTGGGEPSFPGGSTPGTPTDTDTGPRTGGGEPSVPGGTEPGSPDPDDPDPSPGPSTDRGEPSVPGGTEPGTPTETDTGPRTDSGEPSVPGGADPTDSGDLDVDLRGPDAQLGRAEERQREQRREEIRDDVADDNLGIESDDLEVTLDGDEATVRLDEEAQPEPERPGAAGDIDFRFSDTSDRIDDDPQFRTDSRGREIATDAIARGETIGDRIGSGVVDSVGGSRSDERVLSSFAGAGATVPGTAAFIAADTADAARFITEPARREVEPGAQLGVDDLGDIGVETGERTAEIGAAAGDSVIEGADTALDINTERRDEGRGAAIQFTDDQDVQDQLAGELAFSAFALGASGPAGSAARAGAGAAGRTARSAADGGSSTVRTVADDLDAAEFVDDTRGQQQIGNQRARVEADDLQDRQPEPDQGPAAFPDPQGRFEGGAGFSRDSPDRGDVDGPADIDPSGSGDGMGFRSVQEEVETVETAPRADSPVDTDLRTEVGTDGLGRVDATNDPTGITPAGGVVVGSQAAGVDIDAANDPTGLTDTRVRTAPLGQLRSDGLGDSDIDAGPDTDTDVDARGRTDTDTDTIGLTTGRTDTRTNTTTEVTPTTQTRDTTTTTRPIPRTPDLRSEPERPRFEFDQTDLVDDLDGIGTGGRGDSETFENPTQSLGAVDDSITEGLDEP